jgi:hypothetical protein
LHARYRFVVDFGEIQNFFLEVLVCGLCSLVDAPQLLDVGTQIFQLIFVISKTIQFIVQLLVFLNQIFVLFLQQLEAIYFLLGFDPFCVHLMVVFLQQLNLDILLNQVISQLLNFNTQLLGCLTARG